jgi:hypothetical protein
MHSGASNMSSRIAGACVAFTLALGFSSPATAWGPDGHRIVALIAIKLLPPAKAEALNKLLKESAVGRDFVEASGYADDVLRRTHDYDKWHYMDWPDSSKSAADQKCKPTCVLKALSDQIRIAKHSTDKEERALALSWIIHLIGDMHQPLHVAERDHDAGGNGFLVTYMGKEWCGSPSGPGHKPRMNLHTVWDECLVLTLMGSGTREALADDIRGGLTTYKDHPSAKGLRRDWAMETHLLARPTSTPISRRRTTSATATSI